MKKIRNLAIRLAILATPAISLAQPTGVTAPTVDTTETSFTANDLWTQIGVIVNWVVGLIGIAALVFLMYGAYMYMSAGQNEEHLKKAKTSVTYGIIGAVVAVLAFSIFAFAKSLLGAP